jgi:molybdopterin-guanine dinucleotide biosynthesis protein A
MNVGGIVLCGGRSSRMGKPKAWLPFGNELLLQRLTRIVSEAVSPVVVVAAPKQQLPPLPPTIELTRDAVEGRGPLQGIVAGLDALANRCDAAFVSSCDVPFLKPAFIHRLIDLLGDHSISVPEIGDRFHPLAAVYRVSVRDSARRLLVENRLRVADLFEIVPTRVATAADFQDVDPDMQSVRNLNHAEDYEAALRDLDIGR